MARWVGPDGRQIRQHDPETIRPRRWAWLLDRGYAWPADEHELEPFLRRLGRRPAYLRPGLRFLRRWSRDEVAALEERGELAAEIRASVNSLLAAVGDPSLPTQY